MVRIGAHFHVDHPLDEAIARGADAAQFFLGDPQGWKGPVIPGGDPAAIRDAFTAAGVDIYIHAPYVINVATSNNRIRIPSRKILDQQLKAAASVGAKGLIVHGGHVTGGGGGRGRPGELAQGGGADRAAAADADREHRGRRRRHGPVARRDRQALGRGDRGGRQGRPSGANLGFCLDTCHANSAGIDLADAADRIKAITGRIDLVHCNNSRDEFGSGRDRHANIGTGTIDPALLLGVVRAAGAPVICETPDENGGLAADVSWLKQHLAG